MTPKETATILLSEFKLYSKADVKSPEGIINTSEELVKNAKKCALVCVEEILKVCESYDRYNATEFSQVKYWEEVKEHLSKL